MATLDLERQMPWLTPAERTAVDSALADVLGRRDVKAFYSTGSFALGLGNAMSDIDIVAVVADSAHKPSSDDFAVGARTCDVAYIDAESIDGWLNLLAGPPLRAHDYDRAIPAKPVLRHLGRLRYATVLLDEQGVVAAAQARLAVTDLQRWFVQHWLAEGIVLMRDCVGALDAADDETAAEASWRLLWCAAEAVVAASGTTYMSDKLLNRRMSMNLKGPLLAQISTALHSDCGLQRGRLARWRMDLAGHCSALASRLFLGRRLEGTVGAYSPTTSGWRRTPDHLALFIDDGVLIGGRSGLVVPVAAAAVWCMLEGITGDAVSAQFAARLGPAEGPLAAERLLASLRDAGLATNPP